MLHFGQKIFERRMTSVLFVLTVFSVFLQLPCFQTRAQEANPRQSFTFRAEWFSGGDMTLRGLPYSDKYVALCPPSGSKDSHADFEIEFPESGDYEFWAFFSAENSRPLTIELDGAVVSDKALAGTNGSWLTSASSWEKEFVLAGVSAGKHTITVHAFSPDIPHFSAFKLVPLFDMKTRWNVPRAVAEEKIKNIDGWTPSPWSGGWYEYIARDRYLRKESGETFSDHFARETALALAPRTSITVEASATSFDANLQDVDLFDELTYAPGMFGSTPEESAQDDETPVFHLRATFARSADDADSKLPNVETFVVCASRFDEMLDRAAAAIERFRQDSGEDDYLAKTEAKIEDLRSSGKEAFDLYKNDQSDANALKCAELYVAASRLYARVGWANPILDFDKLLYILREQLRLESERL